ncbi:hypothetical protein DY000_02053828 [Brassica cretica]|uniref:Uncharacterized protein n=1 Tax=Brassica cretica TaxID=69181 RepID=A0ABQ7ABK9_BRACR|nr:hypothetical protein DY000_02053828 [Brassica cretica]
MKGLEGGGFIMQGLGKSIECWMVLGLGVAGGRGGGSDGKSISEVGGRGRLTEHTSKDILKNWIGDPIYDESDDEIIELAQAEFATIISGFAFKIKEKEDLESDLEKQSINYALWEKDESVVLPCYGMVKFLDYEKQVGFYFSIDCRQRKSKPPDPTQSKSGHWKQPARYMGRWKRAMCLPRRVRVHRCCLVVSHQRWELKGKSTISQDICCVKFKMLAKVDRIGAQLRSMRDMRSNLLAHVHEFMSHAWSYKPFMPRGTTIPVLVLLLSAISSPIESHSGMAVMFIKDEFMEHSIIPKAPLKHTVYVSHHQAFVNQKKNGDQNTNEWVIYKRFQIRRLINLHIHSPYNSYYLLNAVKEDIRAHFVDYFEVLIQDDYLESGSKMRRVTFQGISFYRRQALIVRS